MNKLFTLATVFVALCCVVPNNAEAGGTSRSFTYSLTSGDPQMYVNIPDGVQVTVTASTRPNVRCVVRVFKPEEQLGSGVRHAMTSGYNNTASFTALRIVNGSRQYMISVTPVVTANDNIYRSINSISISKRI